MMKKGIKTIFIIMLIFSINISYSGVYFYTLSISKAKKQAKAEDKSVMMYFYSPDCGWCSQFKKKVLNKYNVGFYINNNCISIKLNTNYRSSYNVSKRYGITDLPSVVFISSDGRFMGKTEGYKSANSFLREAKKILE